MISKKTFAMIGIAVTLIHLTAYALKPYDSLYFFLGFGVIYLFFVEGLKKM